DNKDFLETKIGIIVELKEEKLRIKEVDKYGNYNKISEIYLDEIELLAVKNYKFWEENYEEKF
ncbi:phage head-tail adapter protein, partial [Fusobacterium simiae]|nr:phage head-tail adapter protein [Fusobacterium simiae]